MTKNINWSQKNLRTNLQLTVSNRFGPPGEIGTAQEVVREKSTLFSKTEYS